MVAVQSLVESLPGHPTHLPNSPVCISAAVRPTGRCFQIPLGFGEIIGELQAKLSPRGAAFSAFVGTELIQN